jgi:hypothetical protein
MKTIKERIAYAEERIRFWEGHPEQQQVWIGIKVELEEISKDRRNEK